MLFVNFVFLFSLVASGDSVASLKVKAPVTDDQHGIQHVKRLIVSKTNKIFTRKTRIQSMERL